MNVTQQVSTVCQLNIGGLSQHSITALDKFIHDCNIEVLALQEIGKQPINLDVFKGKSSFSTNNVKGVALSIATKYKPQLINELSVPDVDVLFVLCSIDNMSVMLASCYCRPEISSTKSLKTLLGQLDKAWLWCKRHKIVNMIALGDYNARSTAWGDSLCNGRGRTLSEYVEERNHVVLHSTGSNTFLTADGGSCIDLSLSYGSIHGNIKFWHLGQSIVTLCSLEHQ